MQTKSFFFPRNLILFALEQHQQKLRHESVTGVARAAVAAGGLWGCGGALSKRLTVAVAVAPYWQLFYTSSGSKPY